MVIYNIPIDNGSILQAVITDDVVVIADNLKKLKSSLKRPVLGIELKCKRNGYQRMLVLSSRTFCLLVIFNNEPPKPVQDFTHDRTICFVHMSFSCHISFGAVELSNLVARVLKKPSLNTCRCLETLSGEVGMEWRQPPKLANEEEVANRCGILFLQEEIEFLIQNAYNCFVIADKLLGSLEE